MFQVQGHYKGECLLNQQNQLNTIQTASPQVTKPKNESDQAAEAPKQLANLLNKDIETLQEDSIPELRYLHKSDDEYETESEEELIPAPQLDQINRGTSPPHQGDDPNLSPANRTSSL